MEPGLNTQTNIQPEDVGVDPMVPGTQPDPLDELSAEERAEWLKFTRRMPPDWFPPETWPMLASPHRLDRRRDHRGRAAGAGRNPARGDVAVVSDAAVVREWDRSIPAERAEDNIGWCERYLFLPEGKHVGEALQMAEFMREDF